MHKTLCSKDSLRSESPKNLAGHFRSRAKAEKTLQEIFALERKLKKGCGKFSLQSENLKNGS